jgi:hypothetical protein
MKFISAITFLIPLASTLFATIADSSDTIEVSFYAEASCDFGFIEARTVAVDECFALANDTWFGYYLVPSTIPDDLLDQGLQLEAGDTNPVDCSVGRCVELSETLGC